MAPSKKATKPKSKVVKKSKAKASKSKPRASKPRAKKVDIQKIKKDLKNAKDSDMDMMLKRLKLPSQKDYLIGLAKLNEFVEKN